MPFRFLKSSLLLLILCGQLSSNAQKNQREKDLEAYIPWNETSLEDFPIITIKVKVHAIAFSDKDPRNIILKDSNYLKQGIEGLNLRYANLEPPTLIAAKKTPHIKDARIRFRVDEVNYYTDSVGWERVVVNVVVNSKWPYAIDSVNLNQNIVYLNERTYRTFVANDSLVFSTKDGPQVLYKDSVFKQNGITCLKLREPISDLPTLQNVTYYKKTKKNCSPDNWIKYTDSNKDYMHIFFTGNSLSISSFGCGPSHYWFNIGNFIFRHLNTKIRLMAHEAGHSMGLTHTKSAQFSDLPSKDKMCPICPCDSIEISNNIMGYNNCKRYLSPYQIGSIYKNHLADPRYIRITSFTDLDVSKTLIIKGKKSISKVRAFGGNVVVTKKATLEISKDIYLPKGATIYLEKKSKLIIDGCKISNAMQDQWEGIRFVNKYRSGRIKESKSSKRAIVIFKNEGKLEFAK